MLNSGTFLLHIFIKEFAVIFSPMTQKKYSESKLYISPEILIIFGVVLVTFWPITIYFYGVPFFVYIIGVILMWKGKKKLLNKIMWTIIPIIVGLIIFKYFIE